MIACNVVFLCVAAAVITVTDVTAAGTCPEKCQCLTMVDGYREAASCANQYRSDIPANFPPNTEYIKYEGNNLVELTRDFTFPSLSKLRRLDLQSGQLRKIGADAFSKLPALEVLNLKSNLIDMIEEGAFRGMPALRILNLENNMLRELPDSAFSALNLKSLLLTQNRLKTIGNDTFKGANVSIMNLSGNAIENFPAKALYPLRLSLTKFVLDNNERQLKIATGAFSGSQLLELTLGNSSLDGDTSFLKHVNAKRLDLSDNHLLPASLNLAKYSSLQTVQHLLMRNMSLTVLSYHLMPNSRALLTIDLSGNKFTAAPGNSFKLVTGLTKVLLGNNLLTRLPEGLAKVLPGLRELKVFSNMISSVDIKTLASYAAIRLHVLDITANRIQTLQESLRPLLKKIDTFMVNGNPLHCNCELLWYREWLDGPGISAHGLYDHCMTPKEEFVVYYSKSDFTCTAPRIANVTPSKLVNEGDDVFLTCSAVADPAPEVEWMAPSGEAISITPSLDRNRKQTMAVWRVAAISRKQGGNYTCTARNLKGNVTVSVCVGVRVPGSAFTVCDAQPAKEPTTTRPPRTTTKALRAETTTEPTASYVASTARSDVKSPSPTSSTSTNAETTAGQQRMTTVRQLVTVTEPRVNATFLVNSPDPTTTITKETTDTGNWTDEGLSGIIVTPAPNIQSSSSSWVTPVVICITVIIIVGAILACVVYQWRKRSSNSTNFTNHQLCGAKKGKLPVPEIALLPQSSQHEDRLDTLGNDNKEKNLMLLQEAETAGHKGKSHSTDGTSDMSSDVNARTSDERYTTEDLANAQQLEGNADPSQSTPAVALFPGTNSAQTNIEKIPQNKEKHSPEKKVKQNDTQKRHEIKQQFLRSYSTNPEGGADSTTGRLSRGETEA